MPHVAFHTFPVPDNSSPAFSSLAFSAPTKRLRLLNNVSHSQQLISLDLENLEVRRLCHDLLLMRYDTTRDAILTCAQKPT